MRAGTLPRERPQERGREQERVDVGCAERGEAERLRRRSAPEDGQGHDRTHQRGLEEEVHPQQPRPPVAAASEQEQAGGRRMSHQQGRQEEEVLAVLALQLAPAPQDKHQRRRHLERGEPHQRVDRAAHQGAAESRRFRPRRPDVARDTAGAGEDAAECAQVVQHRPLGRRRESRVPLPLDLPVARERVRHLDDETVVVSHSALPSPAAPTPVARTGMRRRPQPGSHCRRTFGRSGPNSRLV